MRIYLNKRLICICLLYAFASTYYMVKPVHAQTLSTTPVTAGQGQGTARSFSPSITSFASGSSKYLVSAYVYKSGNTRTVGISRSTNGGNNWTRNKSNGSQITLPTLKFDPNNSSSATLANLDDPQILSLGGDNLVLVVRAWSSNTDYIKGEAYQEQPGTIFVQSGIYLCVSTDAGETWGYWGGSGGSTFDNTKWACIDRNSDFSSSNLTTLEYPRIAFRDGFDTKGYITWEKKTYEENTNLINQSGYKISYLGNTPGTMIGICAFNGNSSILPSGKIYPTNSAGSTNMVYFDGQSLNISEDGQEDVNADEGRANQPPGRERASVAISPDQKIWLGYYSATYIEDDEDCDDNDQVWHGNQSPLAYYFIATGTCNIVGSTNKYAQFNNFFARAVDRKPVPGYWNIKRGYLYLKDFNTERYDNSSCGGGEFPNNPPISFQTNEDFDVDVAQGPCVQIACDQPLTCVPKYHVGYFYIYGEKDFVEPPVPTTHLAFYSATIPNDHEFSDTRQDNQAQYWKSNNDQGNGPDPIEDADNSSDQHIRFFPVLKYSNAKDVVFNKKPTDGSSSFPQSYFAIGYISALRSSTNTQSHFEWSKARTGISFDGKSFRLQDFASTPVVHDFIRDAEIESATGGNVNTDYWGSKMDLCGEYGDFSIHPIWHDIKSTGDNLVTNEAGAILTKAFLSPSLPNDPLSLPAGDFFAANFTGTPSYKWGPFGYFDFDNINRPISGSGNISIAAKPSVSLTLGSYTFDDFYPKNTIPDDGLMPNGLFYGKYINNASTAEPDLGLLGWSSQRKVVVTGQIAHSVFERLSDNTVWYAMNSGPLPQSNTLGPWWNKIPLPDPTSNLKQIAPSIAVYQQGNENGFTGMAAIGVTWTEHEIVGYDIVPGFINLVPIYHYKIMFKTREFNQCSGIWADWSKSYLVYEYANLHDEEESHDPQYFSAPYPKEHMYPPIPVIAPIVTPKESSSAMTCNLLGWTITWGQDRTDAGITHTILNGIDYTNSSQGGLYSRSWMRVNNDPLSSNYHKVIQDNSYWGKFYSASNEPEKWEPVIGFNILEITPFANQSPLNAGEFDNPSVVNLENKYNSIDFGDVYASNTTNNNPNSYSQAVAFNPVFGIWVSNFAYKRLDDHSIALGSLISGAPPSFEITALMPQGTECNPTEDWNPSITVNSTGQQFVAWERMEFHSCQNPITYFSSIAVANSLVGGNWVSSNNIKNPLTIYSEQVSDANDHWLRNPSITAAPKSKLLNVHYNGPINEIDQDLGAVELSFWQQDKIGQIGVNKIWPRRYTEVPGKEGVGSWDINPSNYAPSFGRWSQRSFGTFNAGFYNFNGRSSYAIANDPISDVAFNVSAIGGYKGTFNGQQPFELYRGELRTYDCAWSEFKWGSVYVGDSLSGMPFRQVMLHNGPVVTGYSSHDEERDSIFCSDVFNIKTGEQINYWRGLYYPCCSCADSIFSRLPYVRLSYTIQLVHVSGPNIGRIDTLEHLVFSPGIGKLIPATAVHTTLATVNEDVRIQVKGRIFNIPDADSLCEFHLEEMSGNYSSTQDTVVAFKQSSFGVPRQGVLEVITPNPNPIKLGVNEIPITFSYAREHKVSIGFFDELGRQVNPVNQIASTGSWQNVILPVPKTTGSYHLRIEAGNEVKSYNIIVIK